MELPPAEQPEVSRREFLRRAAMATMATAVASGVYALDWPGAPAATLDAIPPLDVHEFVTGIAATPDRLVAVGGVSAHTDARPAVWRYRFGDRSWARLHASGFPPGTSLSGITSVDGAFLAVGHVQRVNRAHTVLDDRTGRPTIFPVYEHAPAIFRSPDGRAWQQVVAGVPAVWGAFTAIATTGDGALAVGSRFLEPGVTEGYGLIALASRDGVHWDEAALPGVTPPVHGTVTLLARVGSRTLVAINALRTTALYQTSGRRWRPVSVPSADATYVAAAGTERSFLLAGVDATAEPRFWQRTGDGWRERRDLAKAVLGAWVADLEPVDGSVVAAGSREHEGFVTSFGG